MYAAHLYILRAISAAAPAEQPPPPPAAVDRPPGALRRRVAAAATLLHQLWSGNNRRVTRLLRRADPAPTGLRQRRETGGEVSQERRLFQERVAPHRRSPVVHGEDGLDHVVDVALGVDPARDREPHQLHGGG